MKSTVLAIYRVRLKYDKIWKKRTEKESKQRKKYILSQTMEFDDSHCSAESDAGAGGGGGRVYAWGNGSELYFHWPVVVIYACTCIDEVGKLPWVLHHFRKYKWVKDLTR